MQMMTETKTVSVVIPTRNRPELVVEAVKSALNQSYPILEVIVVVDGDDPTSIAMLGSIADSRLRVIALRESVGGSEARNIGIRASLGDWIALLDDDDTWLDHKLAVQMDCTALCHNPCEIICSRVIARAPIGDRIIPDVVYESPEEVGDYLFCRKGFKYSLGFIQTSTLLAPRQMFESVPFRKGLKRHQDWDWLLRVARLPDVRIIMAPEALVVFNIGGDRDSVSRKPDWRFSVEWASEIRPLLTSRAYSHFLGNICSMSIAMAGGGITAECQLLVRILRDRSVSIAAIGWLIYHTVLPVQMRARIRKLLARLT